MIIVNGIEKHGTHALLKTVELLGMPVRCSVASEGAEHCHLQHTRKLAKKNRHNKHLFIIRNPKNAFISYLRDRNLPLQSGMMASRIQVIDEKQTYYQMCKPFLGWLNEQSVHVVRLEDLVSDGGKTIDGIADYLGVPHQPEAFENLPGHTVTWNPIPSDYKKLKSWNEFVQAAWEKHGGLELEKALGYGG